jgi:hypothetical protein
MSTSTGLTTFTLKHDPLTPIEGRPTPEAVRRLRQELYANVRGITTDLGSGQHGHLGLIMPDADYLALPGSAAYILPPTRPALPLYNGTAAVREEAAARYKLQLGDYNDAHGLKEQLMKLLIVAIPSLYLTTLPGGRRPWTSFSYPQADPGPSHYRVCSNQSRRLGGRPHRYESPMG